MTSVKTSIHSITAIIGDHTEEDSDPPSETFLSFILTDGKAMVSYNGGKTIYYSTHKKTCEDKNECAFFNETCENNVKSTDGNSTVNHLILASEPTTGVNIWEKLEPGEIVGVDESLSFFKTKIK